MEGLPDKPNLTAIEFATFLNVSKATIYNWVKEGKYFDPDEILKLDNGEIRIPHSEAINAIELLKANPFKDIKNSGQSDTRGKNRKVRSGGI